MVKQERIKYLNYLHQLCSSTLKWRRQNKKYKFWCKKWKFCIPFVRMTSPIWIKSHLTLTPITDMAACENWEKPYFGANACDPILPILSLAHAPVYVNDFPVVNVHVEELSSSRIWQHKLCATLSANVNINYRLPIKVDYRIWTLRHIRIEINHESQNVFWVLTWIFGY